MQNNSTSQKSCGVHPVLTHALLIFWKSKCSPEDQFGTTSTPTSILGFLASSLESMGWDVIVMLQAS